MSNGIYVVYGVKVLKSELNVNYVEALESEGLSNSIAVAETGELPCDYVVIGSASREIESNNFPLISSLNEVHESLRQCVSDDFYKALHVLLGDNFSSHQLKTYIVQRYW